MPDGAENPTAGNDRRRSPRSERRCQDVDHRREEYARPILSEPIQMLQLSPFFFASLVNGRQPACVFVWAIGPVQSSCLKANAKKDVSFQLFGASRAQRLIRQADFRASALPGTASAIFPCAPPTTQPGRTGFKKWFVNNPTIPSGIESSCPASQAKKGRKRRKFENVVEV